MKSKTIPAAFILLAVVCFFSCARDKGALIVACKALPDTVSFNQNILPIFNKNCSISGCHSGTNPTGTINLTSSLAYTQLSRKGSGYLNISDPASSILYTQMTSLSTPMPPTGNLDPCTIKLVLKWIQQGAKNN